MAIKERPIHLLIRFSDSLFGIGNVVEKHNKIVEEFDSVWFGKIGVPISATHIAKIERQIEAGVKSYVLLAKGNRKKTDIFIADIYELSRLTPITEKHKIPEYYIANQLIDRMKFWIRIGKICELPPESFNIFKVRNSINDLHESLYRSSMGHFVLVKKSDVEK